MHLCYLAISRIRSIRKLEESEKLYRLLANNVKDVIFTLDLDLKYTYVSPSIKLLRGYEPSEVIGNHIISTISGESIKQVTNVLNEQIKQARLGNPETKKDYVMEIELSKKDKGSIWTEIKASFVFDNKNNPYFSLRSLLIPGQNTNVNNIVKETYTLHFEVDKFIQPVQITEYSYEYNLMDYPVKRSDGWEFIYK